jgi:hypothetical protein
VKRFMWSLAVNPEGRSGGLILLWSTNTICLWLQSLCSNFIDVKVKEESGLFWRVSFVYGEPKDELRHIFWDRLRFLKAQWDGPWVRMGDFSKCCPLMNIWVLVLELKRRSEPPISGMSGGLPSYGPRF